MREAQVRGTAVLKHPPEGKFRHHRNCVEKQSMGDNLSGERCHKEYN